MRNYIFDYAAQPDADGLRVVVDISQGPTTTRRAVTRVIDRSLIKDTIDKFKRLGHKPVCVINCKRKD